MLSRNNGSSSFSNSSISDFLTYNSALTGTQILNNFNNSKSKYGY